MSNQLPATTTATKLTPGELPLTLTADVLRAPYTPATRLVLAEVVSLYAATGNCYCSDAHFAARLTLSKDTASVAVQLLVADGLLARKVDKAAGNVRYLVPVPAAISAKAATNPYPENSGSPTRKNKVGYPENPGSPTRKNKVELPGNSGTNTTVNNTEILQESHTLPEPEKKIGVGEFLEDSTSSLKAEVRLVPPVAEPPHAGQPGPVGAAELPEALKTEVKDLATEMGKMWGLSEQHGFAGWSRLYAFAKHQAQQGQLPELRAQLAGYKAGHMRPGVRAHKLGDWLGDPQHEVGPYRNGVWCSCTWADIAAKVQARPTGATQSAPTPTRAGGSPSQAAAYRPR